MLKIWLERQGWANAKSLMKNSSARWWLFAKILFAFMIKGKRCLFKNLNMKSWLGKSCAAVYPKT